MELKKKSEVKPNQSQTVGSRRRRLQVVDPTSWLARLQMASSTPPPLPWVRGSSELPGFSVTERLKPARLLRLLILTLLLGSSINPIPGPYKCSPSSLSIRRNQASVWCHICGWIHFKCSGLKFLKRI